MLSLRSLWLSLTGGTALAVACAAMPAGGGSTMPPQQGTGAVTVYDGLRYRGRTATMTSSWSGGGYWDRRIRSVRVAHGYRVTLYTEPNYQGTETRLTESWAPENASAYWVGRARSMRIARAAVQPVPPTPPGGATGTLPTVYTEAGYHGRVRSGNADWPGVPPNSVASPYATTGSIRIPRGWRIEAYSQVNYQGFKRTLTSDWSGGGRAVRSFRVFPPRVTPQPR